MKREALVRPRLARSGTVRIGSEALRAVSRLAALMVLPGLLAACAADGSVVVAEGAGTETLNRPAKVSTAKAGPAKASAAKAGATKAGATKVTAAKVSVANASTARVEPPRVEPQPPPDSSLTAAAVGKVAAGTIVELPYRPAVGSRWIGTTELRETKSKDGRVVESTIVRERGEYRVVQKLGSGYRVAVTTHDGSIEGNTPLVEIMKPLVQATKGQSFAYETDEGGTPVRVVDIDRWKALAVKAVDAVAQSKPDFASVPQLKQFIDGMRAQFGAATPETGVALFLEPVIRYTMVQGLTDVPVGEERTYDDEVAHPFTGTRMRAKGAFKVVSVDRAAGLATVEWRLTVLPEDIQRATREFIMRFAPPGEDSAKVAKKLDDDMAQTKVEHVDRATYRIALADGVVRRMDRTAIVRAHEFEKKTVAIMTLSPLR